MAEEIIDDDDMEIVGESKPAPAPRAAKVKQRVVSSDSDEDEKAKQPKPQAPTSRALLPGADIPSKSSDHVDIAMTDQLNAVYGLCSAAFPLLLAQEAQQNFVRELESMGVPVPTFQELHRDRRRNRMRETNTVGIRLKASELEQQLQITGDKPTVIDYSSSAYRPNPQAPELDLLPEEEEKVPIISAKEQVSLELGMFMDWGTNTESALAVTNDKHRLFKYVARVPQFRQIFSSMPAHVRASFLSDDPTSYFAYAVRETPFPKPFLNKEQLDSLKSMSRETIRATGLLLHGDPVHVPFTQPEIDILLSMLPLTKEKDAEIARRLPGRTAVDAYRFLQQRIRHKSLKQPELIRVDEFECFRPVDIIDIGDETTSDSLKAKAASFGVPISNLSFSNLGLDGNNIDIVLVYHDPAQQEGDDT